jgi:hypothetical protein
VNTHLNRKPTPDEAACMAWWNILTEGKRAEWLKAANGETPADAWAAFKRTPDGQSLASFVERAIACVLADSGHQGHDR